MGKRNITPRMRHALQVLAGGGCIIHHAGVRGALISHTLKAVDDPLGEAISPATFRALLEPGEVVAGRKFPEPPLIRQTRRDGMGRVFTITAAGRERLAQS